MQVVCMPKYIYKQTSLSFVCAGKTESLYFELPDQKSRPIFQVYGLVEGLLCISTIEYKVDDKIYLWNPSIRKLKSLPDQDIVVSTRGRPKKIMASTLGFGFHRAGNDYKVVRIVKFICDIYQVKVYSLRLDSWRRIRAALPFSSCPIFDNCGTYLNGVVYWPVHSFPAGKYILSLDMSSEVFQKIKLPDTVLNSRFVNLGVFEKSLSVIYHDKSSPYYSTIWVREMDNWKMICRILVSKYGSIPAGPLIGFN